MIRLASLLNESNDLDSIAQSEFGMDYHQLGPNEQEWCRDELDNRGLAECGGCERDGVDYTHGHDHEASMADGELRDLISNASKLQNLIQPGDELPGWVSAYITLASDYMHSVAEYMTEQGAEMQQEPEQATPGYAVYETKKKPSAGMTAKQKSAVAKKVK